jgi:ZIP family zinc transporter
MHMMIAGLLASTVAGLATGLGALPGLWLRHASDRLLDSMLGFAAGVMVAAAVFSLLLPALQLGGLWGVIAGFVCGSLFVDFLDRVIPHTHFIQGREGPAGRLRRIWLLILAMTIHNIPEGLSVGVSFGVDNPSTSMLLATAIGLQNMPEGLAVALPLIREGYGKGRAVMYATLSGLVEPVAGVVGVLAVAMSSALLPFSLAFAAGAMLYVVFDEIIPESHGRGYHKEATFGAILGFVVMMTLDNIFS